MHHKKKYTPSKPKVYIHYGAATFDPAHKNQPARWDKPSGLWASPENAGWGWKDFVKADWEDQLPTLTKSFRFTLKKGTKILQVKTMQDIMPYLLTSKEWYQPVKLDHAALLKDYDGMELYYSGNYNFHDTRLFYAWDCDSLVLWNTERIKVIK